MMQMAKPMPEKTKGNDVVRQLDYGSCVYYMLYILFSDSTALKKNRDSEIVTLLMSIIYTSILVKHVA